MMTAVNMDDYNRQVIEEFRANGGKLGGRFANGALLLLTTTGAKSGRPSKLGAPSHPDWYRNLVANPL